MKTRTRLDWAVLTIAVITLASGVSQLVAPHFVLDMVAAQSTPTSAHFFAIIGMFMALFGAALFHASVSSPPDAIVVLWAGVQKFAAVAAVGVGVERAIFSPAALLIASFDLVSGVVVFAYWLTVRQPHRHLLAVHNSSAAVVSS